MNTWDAVRILNIAMTVVVMALFAVVVHRRVRASKINARELLFRTGFLVYLGAATYATAENLHLDAPGGPRLILLSVGLLWMLLGIVQIERNQRKPK